MAVEQSANDILATADVEGVIKVWNISDYCNRPTTSSAVNVEPPPLLRQFKPHFDMVTALEVVERNGRMCILTASYDQTAQVWDTDGEKIGVFGQEDHWKIERKVDKPEMVEGTDVPPDSQESDESSILAVEPPLEESESFDADEASEQRINIWHNTRLGIEYEEARLRKRERPPLTLAMDSMLSQFAATAAAPSRGTYATLNLQRMVKLDDPLHKPEFMRTDVQLDLSTPPATTPKNRHVASPSLQGLKTVFDDKSLFPKYILDHEQKMHQQLQQILLKEAEKEKLTAAPSDTATSHRDSAIGRSRVPLKGHTTKR